MPNNTVPLRKRAGQLRHRVTLQEGVVVTDETGGGATTWVNFASDWAAFDSIAIVPNEVEAAVLYQVSMRFRPDVSDRWYAGTAMRVLRDNLTYKVLAFLNPEERKRDMVLHCGRVTG